jgi:hypothetical protein
MKRSSMLDAVLVTAFLIGATAMTAFVRGTPERCPQANPSSVEALFAPCLAASRSDMRPPADVAALYLRALPVRSEGTMVARPSAPERDVETTGTLAPPR